MDFVNIKYDDSEKKEELISNLFFKTQYNKNSKVIDQDNPLTGAYFVKKIINTIKGDLTVLIEDYHIDRFYRDCYYMYFSNQHFQIDRYCKRVSFFKGYFEQKFF